MLPFPPYQQKLGIWWVKIGIPEHGALAMGGADLPKIGIFCENPPKLSPKLPSAKRWGPQEDDVFASQTDLKFIVVPI